MRCSRARNCTISFRVVFSAVPERRRPGLVQLSCWRRCCIAWAHCSGVRSTSEASPYCRPAQPDRGDRAVEHHAADHAAGDADGAQRPRQFLTRTGRQRWPGFLGAAGAADVESDQATGGGPAGRHVPPPRIRTGDELVPLGRVCVCRAVVHLVFHPLGESWQGPRQVTHRRQRCDGRRQRPDDGAHDVAGAAFQPPANDCHPASARSAASSVTQP
jgi:hypothetical protein